MTFLFQIRRKGNKNISNMQIFLLFFAKLQNIGNRILNFRHFYINSPVLYTMYIILTKSHAKISA